MHKKLTLFSTIFIALWLTSCSHLPMPWSKAPEEPTPPLSAQGLPTQGTPAAVVAEAEFDFGEIADGNDYVHDFKIANKGDGVLQIIKVLPA